ncbi:MAG: tetratricopeptide repeat protein [Planctomycetes bacterium]|jgi:tetratricopeptide (TPR) repeat protein|nr:tetratricopeptide repeat protein [Planctomycetota bacterium]
MAARYFNWKLASVLLVAVVVFTAAAYALHRWQKSTTAAQSLSLGCAAYDEQNYDEAASHLGRYIAVNGGTVEVLLKYADAQLNRRPLVSNNVQQAVAAYREALRLDPRNLEATRRLMEVYLWPSMGAPGEAELIGRRYLENQDDPTIHRMHADALWQQRKVQDVATELTAILAKHPEDVLSYERMGILAEQHPNLVTKPAATWYDEAVGENPDAALAYIARAGFYLRHNEGEKARADLTQAQKLNLSEAETRLRLISTLKSANELDQARTHLQVLQRENPKEKMLWLHWADLAARAKSVDEMSMVAREGLKALAAQPWDFMPFATELLVRSGHVAEANDYIARMREKDVNPPTTAFLEGLVAERQGQLRDAIAGWRKAITLGYRQATVHLMLADALSRLGDTQSAIGQLRILVTEEPGTIEGHLALARLLVQTREWQEVLAQAGEILQLSPNHFEALLLEVQARTHLLAANAGASAPNEALWQEVETRLGQLDKASAGALPVKLLQAQVATIRGKLPEAAAQLTELARTHSEESRVMLLYAELCARQGKEAEAQKRFEDAVAKFPQDFEPVRSLALFLDQRNRRPECEAVVREAMARVTEPRVRRDLGLVLAELYRQGGQEQQLRQWLNDLAAQFPNDIQPKRLLLTRDEVLKDARQAQRLIDEIKALEGDGGWQWRYEQAKLWNRSDAADFKTYYAQTVKLLQENLLTNPKDHASRLLLADTYEKANELTLAATTYKEALNLLPNQVPVLVRMISLLTRMKDFAEARSYLDRAQQANLHDPALDQLRLLDDLRVGKLQSAVAALEKRIETDPNDAAARLNLVLVRMREKKYDEAQTLLDALKAKTPDSPAVIGAQIDLYIQQGKANDAIALCDQMVQKQHDTAAYLLRARTYIALKQNAQALEDFGRIIALEPQQAESWVTRADFYRVIGRVQAGIGDIRRALALAPEDRTVQKLAVLLFIASRDMPLINEAEAILDQALPVLEKTASASPADPRAAQYSQFRLLKAQVLVLKGTGPGLAEARRILREITASQPVLAEAWQLLAQLELSQEDPTKAMDVALRGLTHNEGNGPLLLLKARAEKIRSPAMAVLTLKGLLEQYPGNVEVLVDLADAYARAGRTQQAVDVLREKLPNFEGDARRRCEIAHAEALYANGQRDEARTLFETLMQAEPNDPTPTMTLAQQLRRERRWTEMNQLVRRWLVAHPKDADVATTIARVLAATGDKQALLVGEDILRMTLEHNPRSMSSLMLLSMMMQDAGRSEEAARLNRQILEIDPNNVVALNNLAWLLCDGENSTSQYQEALTLAQKGLKLVPDYVDLLDTRGYAYYRLGDFDQAHADFTRCIELYPTNSPLGATPRYHLAMTYAAMKRRVEATEQLRMALDSNLGNLRSAKEQADAGRVTYAIKVLKDAILLQEQMEPLKAALGLQGQAGGATTQEIADAKAQLERLLKGNY